MVNVNTSLSSPYPLLPLPSALFPPGVIPKGRIGPLIPMASLQSYLHEQGLITASCGLDLPSNSLTALALSLTMQSINQGRSRSREEAPGSAGAARLMRAALGL